MINYESNDRQWFALLKDGSCVWLGDCGDEIVAKEIADNLYADRGVVFVFKPTKC